MKLYEMQHAVVLMLAIALLPVTPGVYAAGQAATVVGAELPGRDTRASDKSTLKAIESRKKAQESVDALSGEIQQLKTSVITLNKDLRVLEEDLLFPADTQLNVFVSLDVGKFFTLESVKLNLDGKVVATHVYTEKELVALEKGGIQKLHMANLSIGQHTLSAIYTGIGPNGREYKRGTTRKINKKNGPKYVELKIADSTMKLQPDFSVKEW
jgi:hypothetical protein